MAVKRSKSGTRILDVLEQIARQQPIGVSDLAREMEADKSAIQRAIMTLADGGWIHALPGRTRQWQLTGHIHLVAHLAHSRSSLRQRALPALASLRDETGESTFLTVPDVGRFVVIEVMESRELLRASPYVGAMVLSRGTATGLSILPYLAQEEQERLLGAAPDAMLRASFRETLATGYAISEDATGGGSIIVAAPIFEMDGRPSAAICLSAPAERLPLAAREGVAMKVLQTAQSLSQAPPRVGPTMA